MTFRREDDAHIGSKNITFPKVIWMFWAQGAHALPSPGKQCVCVWKRKNPDYKVIVLDEKSLREWIEADDHWGLLYGANALRDPRTRANLARLLLLNRYGGGGSDIDVLCMQPLNEWLPKRLPAGFFAFSRPGVDRLLANWFLAATPATVLIERWTRTYQEYWTERRDRRLVSVGWRYPHEQILRHRPHWWIHPLVRWLTWGYPVYAAHYAFAYAVKTDRTTRDAWARTPTLPAEPALYARRHGLDPDPDGEVTSWLLTQETPVFKLARRNFADHADDGSLQSRLLARAKDQA